MPIFRTFTSFGGLPSVWREFIDAKAVSFDQTVPWLELFEKHLLTDSQRVVVAAVEDGPTGRPIAVLPLRTGKIPLLGAYSAAGVASLSNYYTALFAPIGEAGCEQVVSRVVAERLSLRSEWPDVLDFNPVAADSSYWPQLKAELTTRGYRVEQYFRFANWYLEVAGRSSAEYLETLPSQLRSTIARKGRKLRAQPDSRISIVTHPDEVDRAMDLYEGVYNSSWKIEEPHRAFIRDFARAAANRGWLRLGLVEVGGSAVAAQLWFVYRGTASIFKLAYDQRFAALSAGSVLTHMLMQSVIDQDRVETVDYLSGDDSYKKDWMSSRRVRLGFRAVRRISIAGTAQALVSMVKRIRKR